MRSSWGVQWTFHRIFHRTCLWKPTCFISCICMLFHWCWNDWFFVDFTCWVQPACNEALLEMFRIDYVGDASYVSCIPSVVHHRLSSSDRFLVLSSDGLYQYFSNEEVVAHVSWFMENVPEGDPAQYLVAELLFRAAKKNGMIIEYTIFLLYFT